MRAFGLLLLALAASATPAAPAPITPATATATATAATEHLLAWAVAHGANASAVMLADTPFGRGVVAQQFVGAGCEAFSVPAELALSVAGLHRAPALQQAAAHPAGRAVAARPRELVVLLLLHEVLRPHGDSFWQPYLDTLPSREQLARSSVHFQPELTRRVMAPTLDDMDESLREAAEVCGRLAHFVRRFPDVFPGAEERGVDDLVRWAFVVFRSRAWNNVLGSGGSELIPLLDLVNHDAARGGTAVGGGRDGRGVALAGPAGAAPGEQLFVHYLDPAENCERDLVRNFGFADAAMTCVRLNPAGMEPIMVRAADLRVQDVVGGPDAPLERLRDMHAALKGVGVDELLAADEAVLAARGAAMIPIERALWQARIHERRLIQRLVEGLEEEWMRRLSSSA